MTVRFRFSALALCAFLYALGASASGDDDDKKEREPAVHRVSIQQMRYVPATLELRAGDKIVWVNEDIFPHTVTAADKSLDSGLMTAKQSWSWVAGEKGEHPYVCTYHPTMKGTVIVK